MTYALARLRALATALVAVCALGALSASAGADSIDGVARCNGDSIVGTGASFQAAAHAEWIADFDSVFCSGAFDGSITYNATGSGAGRTAIRNRTADFAATDDPLTAEEFTQIDDGPELGAEDDARIKQFPIAAGSIPVLVRLPRGCTVTEANRVMDLDDVEAAFRNAEVTRWGQILPGITGRAESDEAECRDVSFRRVVRLDVSGTTHQLKRYFHAANGGFGWLGLANNVWPNDAGATTVLRGASAGNGPLVARLSENGNNLDLTGGIGYSDLATARNNAPSYRWDAGEGDQFFWVAIDSGGGVRLPSVDNESPDTGSNCEEAEFDIDSVDPDELPGRADWRDVDAIDTTAGYPRCVLTYALAYEDGEDAGQTEAETRSTVDYLSYATSAAGQELLEAAGYSPLPAELLEGVVAESLELMGWDLPEVP